MRTEPLRLTLPYVRDTCRQIQRVARTQAGFDASPYRKRRGIHLRTSIQQTTRITGPTSITGRVGSELDHALVHHEGARPHTIVPRAGGGRLRFFWEKRGRWVSLPRVSHPGHGPNPYLTLPLLVIGTERDFIVIIARTPF